VATILYRFPQSAASYFWALPPGLVPGSLGKAGKLEPRPLKKPGVTWHKPLCWRDTPTPNELESALTWLCPLSTSVSPSGCATLPPKPQVALTVHAIDLAAAAHNDPNALPREAAKAHFIVMAIFSFACRRIHAPAGAPHDPHCAVSYLQHSFLARSNLAPAHQQCSDPGSRLLGDAHHG
jgi:hypothetical protein